MPGFWLRFGEAWTLQGQMHVQLGAGLRAFRGEEQLEAMRVCGDCCAESLQEGLESREECVRPQPLRGFLEEAGLEAV